VCVVYVCVILVITKENKRIVEVYLFIGIYIVVTFIHLTGRSCVMCLLHSVSHTLKYLTDNIDTEGQHSY